MRKMAVAMLMLSLVGPQETCFPIKAPPIYQTNIADFEAAFACLNEFLQPITQIKT